MERDKALEMAVAQIEKQFGKGSIMRLGEGAANMSIQAISTGALSLDVALGIGGLPRGRIVEVFGPEASGKTTVALHVVAEAQRGGGVCAFIDAEHALDPVYAGALGVNVDELLVSQPDTGEQGLEIADMLIRSGAIDVVVIDSVAALVPRAEIEGEMGDVHIGLQARLMSQALRKLAGNLSKSRTICIFINQLREKIGVMFGCFSGSTRVTLADGTQERIGKIVNQRMPVEVLSYDPEAGAVVPKRVVDWFDNGRADHFLQFTVARPGGNGRAQFGCTPNHQIRTPAGWKEALELSPGDRVMQAVPHKLSDFQWQVVFGSLMGDGALSPSRSGLAARFRWGHTARQAAYGDWKASLFGNVGLSRSTNAKQDVFYDLSPLPELAELRKAVYVGGKKIFNDDYLKQLTPLALAIWYMDDASFSIRAKGPKERTRDGSGRVEICVEAMEPTTRTRLAQYLSDGWGIRPTLVSRASKAVLQFPKDETTKLHALIAPFVHPSMDYKLLPRFRNRFAVEPVFAPARYELMPVPIRAIHRKPQTRSMHRFDIEVEGSHNYLADGVVVHNSPEITPGGRALKYYASVRLDVRRVESIKDGAENIGNRVRAKVVKNKCLAEGTRVFDPTTGLTHRIEDIVERGEGAAVVAADKLGKLHARPIVDRMDQGEQQVIGLSFRDSTTLWATPDHRILSDRGWREAGELRPGDMVARPRRVGGFGAKEPVAPDHARLLGYLIGDGYVGGRTPITFINAEASLHEDVACVAAGLGCDIRVRGIEACISHRPGEKNGVLELARWAGIWGHLAPAKRVPPALFDPEVSEAVVANLLFGLWETDGYISREQTGGIRVGFTTTSEQLAHQIKWLLLRFGIGSTASVHKPGSRRSLIAGRPVVGKLPCWQVRVSGIDNVTRFAAVVPTWGPKGKVLTAELTRPLLRTHRGSRQVYLPECQTEPVLEYLRALGITASLAAQLIGKRQPLPKTALKQVLGKRLRRDHLTRLADALGSEFLESVLDEDVYYDRVWTILGPEVRRTYDIEVDELHTFVAEGVVVHNCAPPFRQAEFDLTFGKGISREGSLLDVAVDHDIVKKSGAWYTYEGEQLGQGRENAKQFLAENVEIALELDAKVREAVGLTDRAKTAVVPTEVEEPVLDE